MSTKIHFGLISSKKNRILLVKLIFENFEKFEKKMWHYEKIFVFGNRLMLTGAIY